MLSPLTRDRLAGRYSHSYTGRPPVPSPSPALGTPSAAERAAAAAARKATAKWAEAYRRYACPRCDELHRGEWGAENCCPPAIDEVWVHPTSGERFESPEDLAIALQGEPGAPLICPVCHSGCKDAHDAANCCLWKDLGIAERFRIAGLVEAGRDWADAIATVTGKG